MIRLERLVVCALVFVLMSMALTGCAAEAPAKGTDDMKYSECDDDAEFEAYFGALSLSARSYKLAEKDGEKYVLFTYLYSDYGAELTEMTGAEKSYSGNALEVTTQLRTRDVDLDGCIPNMGSVDCVLLLEHDIDKLTVDGVEYEPFSGGLFRENEKYGAVDADMNVILPAEYELIRSLDTDGFDETYYFCSKDGGSGVLDENFRPLLSPVYSNIFYTGDGKFIVMREKGKDGLDDEIGIVDSGDNVVHEFIDGFIDGNLDLNNKARQLVFGRLQDGEFLTGVIDSELNVVIEPIYEDITVFAEDSDDMFYVVENGSGEFAVFDTKGAQKTEFEASSVYEVQTAYFERLGK